MRESFGSDPEALKRTRHGELGANLLQAACRGLIRVSIDGDCPPGCTLHLAFSTYPTNGFPAEMLQEIFPGAKVVDWNKPEADPLTLTAKAILEALEDGEWKRKQAVRRIASQKLGKPEIADKTLRDALAQLEKRGYVLDYDGQSIRLVVSPKSVSPGR